MIVGMSSDTEKSHTLYARACKSLVGGVNSPVRAYGSVELDPLFIARAEGVRVIDVDGTEYLDYVGSYGPMILGHAHEQVVTAVSKAVRNGTSYGASTELEIRLAERVVRAVPSVEKVRFVSSGTEAVMTAVRLARGATGHSKIVKFVGCYHGHSDALLVQAGSGAATLGVPSSPGVPPGATADTILLPYNDLAAVEEALAEHGAGIAAVLVEPVAGNMGVVPPADGFLPGLRTLCDGCGALLIFDEVMTGFRVGPAGAQGLYDITPDLTTLGKVIGGGMPVGAVAGPAALMDHLAPVGKVYQAGTLSGNPVAMAAGLATLDAIAAEDGFYDTLNDRSASLARQLDKAAEAAGLGEVICIQRVGSMVCVFFTPGPVVDYATAAEADRDAFAAFFSAMQRVGIFLPPSQFEAWFVSAAHSADDIKATAEAAGRAFQAAANVMKSR